MQGNAGETQELREVEDARKDWSEHVKEIGGLVAVEPTYWRSLEFARGR